MKKIRRYAFITLGSLIFSAGFSLFIEPAEIAPGGLSGLLVLISHIFPNTDSGLAFFLMNLPLLIVGAIVFGWKFFFGTIWATVISSFGMSIIDYFIKDAPTTDIFCLSLAGALFLGVGLGIVFRENATTGGTDIIVRLIQKRFPHLRVGYIFLMIDSVIVIMSGIVFREIETLIYSGFVLSLSSLIFNYTLYGGFRAEFVVIIDENTKELTEKLCLVSGVTIVEGVGAYSGRKKSVLICAVERRKYPSIALLIKDSSPNAIVITTPADGFFHGHAIS